MSRVCEICGKKPLVGNTVSHANNRHKMRQLPNLKTIHAKIDGSNKTVRVCTKCIKKGKVTKA